MDTPLTAITGIEKADKDSSKKRTHRGIYEVTADTLSSKLYLALRDEGRQDQIANRWSTRMSSAVDMDISALKYLML